MKIKVAAFAAIMAAGLPSYAQPTEEAAPAAPAAEAAPAEAEAPAESGKPAKPPKPISYFEGIFQGPTTVQDGSGAGTMAAGRESRVEIKADGAGFMVTWSTVYVDDDNTGELKIKDSTEIKFAPTATAGAYGQADAGALWTGKPYYWARIEGDTMHVSALVLDADGTYDVTHYARTLQGDTMRLEFTRFKDGLLQRSVTGTLKRSDE
jgi:hypothetical protein